MRTVPFAAALGMMVMLGACDDFDAPNQNNSTLSELTSGAPSQVAVATAAQGLIGTVAATNAGLRGAFGFNYQVLGRLGRDGYNLDVSNPQNTDSYYNPVAGNGFKNLQLWTGPYATLKQANIVIAAADAATSLSAAQKEGFKGLAKTIKGIMLWYVVRGTDTYGAVLDALPDPTMLPLQSLPEPMSIPRSFSTWTKRRLTCWPQGLRSRSPRRSGSPLSTHPPRSCSSTGLYGRK